MSPGDGGTCMHGRPLLICQECAGPYFMGMRSPQPIAFDDATIVKLCKAERERARLAALEGVAREARAMADAVDAWERDVEKAGTCTDALRAALARLDGEKTP